jgi:hypothetical protein
MPQAHNRMPRAECQPCHPDPIRYDSGKPVIAKPHDTEIRFVVEEAWRYGATQVVGVQLYDHHRRLLGPTRAMPPRARLLRNRGG